MDTTLLINTVPGNYTVSFEWQPLPTTSPNTGEYEWQVALCQGTCYGDAPNCEIYDNVTSVLTVSDS